MANYNSKNNQRNNFKGKGNGKSHGKSNRPDQKFSKRGSNYEEPAMDNEQSEDFAYGKHAVTEALQAGRGNKLFVQEDIKGNKIQELKDLAQASSVPVQWVPKSKLDDLSNGGVHQGVVLGITAYEYLTLETLLEQTKDKTDEPFFLLLDGIEDPHNFGSILRTADATGVDGVIIPKHRAVGITSIVAKTSTGAVEHIPVARVTNLTQAVQKLKENQFWIFGTDMSGKDYRTWDTHGSVGLIIGNEGRGMGTLLKKEVDEMLSIPMTGHVQSLNAGVAAGLLMYEVYRKRNA